MRVTERVMLYVVAIVVGCMLVTTHDASIRESPLSPLIEPNVNTTKSDVASHTSVSAATDKSLTVTVPQHNPSEPFAIRDDTGHARIEMLVNEDGQASLVLRNQAGDPGIILAVDADGVSEATVVRGDHLGKVLVTKDGDLSLTLTGAQSGFTATVASDGGSDMLLTGKHGSRAAMSVDPDGIAEVRVTGVQRATQAFMRTLPDGVGEFAVRGNSSDSGPTMIRTSNGVSILSTQLPGGTPGTSMISSPEGISVIAVQSPDGKSEASLRVNRAGEANIFSTAAGE